MTWFATFQCLHCEHFWREPAPADSWEMVCKVAATVACPLCGAQMREGWVELLSHSEGEVVVFSSVPHLFKTSSDDSCSSQ